MTHPVYIVHTRPSMYTFHSVYSHLHARLWILCKRNVHRVKRRGKLHEWRREAYAPIPAKQRNPLHFVSTLYADHPASLSSRGTFPPPFFSHSTPRYVNSLPPGCLSGRARSRGFSLSSLCYLHTFFSVDNLVKCVR